MEKVQAPWRLDGVWLGNGWLRVVRNPDEQSSVLVREQALHVLQAQIEQARQRVAELQAQVEQGQADLHSAEQAREATQAQLRKNTKQHAEEQTQKSARQERLNQMRARGERLRNEIATVRGDLARDEDEMAGARERLEEALMATAGHAAQREQLILQRDDKRRVLEEIRQRARADREARHAVAVRVETARTQL